LYGNEADVAGGESVGTVELTAPDDFKKYEPLLTGDVINPA